jgi:polyhydroxyalkanoate synthase
VEKAADNLVDSYFAEMERIRERVEKGLHVLTSPLDTATGLSEKETVLEIDKLKLYHYKPLVKNLYSPPVLGIYALVNKQYMLDLQPDRSLVRHLLENGLDVYLIDWGYPSRSDRFLTLEDYIDGYIDDVVDFVCKRHGVDKLTILSICQGGTLSLIYSALYTEKVKNLITMVTPLDFDTDTGLLNVWSRYFDIDQLVDTYGIVPGDFMNIGFLLLNPFRLMFDKYMTFLDHLDDKDFISNFIRMEKWIFDSPDQAGETYRRFLKEFYQENRLIKGEFELGGRKVDLKNVTIPILNVYAEFDNLVPPASSEGITDAVGSKDKQSYSFKTGHIGMFVSSRSRKEICPTISKWIQERSTPPGNESTGKAGSRKRKSRGKK